MVEIWAWKSAFFMKEYPLAFLYSSAKILDNALNSRQFQNVSQSQIWCIPLDITCCVCIYSWGINVFKEIWVLSLMTTSLADQNEYLGNDSFRLFMIFLFCLMHIYPKATFYKYDLDQDPSYRNVNRSCNCTQHNNRFSVHKDLL